MYFIFGTIIASFISVLIIRLPEERNFITERSECDYCHHPLSWYEMIPVLSFIALKGRCHHCHHKISINIWITEVLGGILAVVLHHYYSLPVTIYFYTLIMVLYAISVIDLRYMIIPDVLLYVLLLLSCISLYYQGTAVLELVLSLLSVAVFMLLMNCIIHDSFGLGDIKLMTISGILLGANRNILAFVLAVILAAVYSFYLVITKKATKKDFIAFGPFLCIGILISLFKGYEILSLCM